MVTPLHEGLVGIATLDPGYTAQMLRTLFDLQLGIRAKGRLTSCDLSLVVICPDKATADWAREPIDLGHPEFCLVPLVIGPDNTPVITDVAQAIGNIGLAVIASITRSEDPRITDVLATLTEALNSIDPELARGYAEFVTVALRGNAQKEMERLMATETYLYQGEYAKSLIAKGKAQGKAEGEAWAILRLLDRRGIQLSDADRERIASCTDLSALNDWFDRVLTVESTEELFAE